MEKNRLFIFAGTIIIVVFGIVLFLSLTEPSVPPNVKVSYTPPVETPTPINQNKQKPLVPQSVSANSPLPSASGEINEPSASIQQESFTLHIQDAMGEPIAGGMVLAGSKEYKFTKGELSIAGLASAEIPASVSAEGYSPMTTILKPQPGETQTIVMDYLSSFELYVSGAERNVPASDATIRVWKAANPERPPLREYQIISSSDGDRINSVDFRLEQWEYRVNRVGNAMTYRWYNGFDPFKIVHPKTGDTLVALGKCNWSAGLPAVNEFSGMGWFNYVYLPRSDYKSNKSRISDTLRFSSGKEAQPLSNIMEKCEILRSGKQGWFLLKFPELSPETPVWRELKTDGEGKYLLRDLPPALYYAQAVKDNQTSEIVPLHPCCGGATIKLATTGSVLVIVKRSRMENQLIDFSELVESEFTLQGIENTSGLYTANTGRGGKVLNVAYGNYMLRVIPWDGQPVEKRVTVQHPREKFEILISDYEQYSINGIVIDDETNQPVAGYDLMIDELGYKVKSGPDGKFVFTGLIPYIYKISAPAPDDGIIKYLPVASNRRPRKEYRALANIIVPDERTDPVEIKVRKAVHTKFSGAVVDSQGKPVEGANVYISKTTPQESFSAEYIGTYYCSDDTKSNGGFSLDKPGLPVAGKEPVRFEITAMSGQLVYKTAHSGFDTSEYQRFEPNAAGSLTVQGHAGDTFDNLVITVAAKFENTVHGRLIAEEVNFDQVHIFTNQNFIYPKTELQSDGAFMISNIAAGDFVLHVNPSFETVTETTFETITEKKYLQEQIKLTMPANQKEMYVDIKLRRSETLTGTIGYPDGSPLRFASIKVVKEKDDFFTGEAETNHKGVFKVKQLTSDAFYQLTFFDKDTKQKIYTSDWVSPGMGEVNFHIK